MKLKLLPFQELFRPQLVVVRITPILGPIQAISFLFLQFTFSCFGQEILQIWLKLETALVFTFVGKDACFLKHRRYLLHSACSQISIPHLTHNQAASDLAGWAARRQLACAIPLALLHLCCLGITHTHTHTHAHTHTRTHTHTYVKLSLCLLR